MELKGIISGMKETDTLDDVFKTLNETMFK